jgi:hypothetical protein
MPRAEVEPLVRRLAALCAAGVVDEVRVRTWDRYVAPDDSSPSPAWRHLRRFLRHAPADAPVAPVVDVATGRVGPGRRVHRVPVAVLAEYRDGRLVAVTPGGSGAVCVLARLEDLTRAVARTPGGATAATTVDRPDGADPPAARNVPA